MLLLWPIALLVIAGFCMSGSWQLSRMHQKEAMLAAVQRVLSAREAKPLALAADTARASDYDWVAGDGRFIDAPAVLLDNQSRDDRSGVRAYRVFQPRAPGALPLLVDLGWLPLPGDRTMPVVAALPAPMMVQGLLAPPPSHGLIAATLSAQADGTLLTTGLDAPGLRSALGQPLLAARVLKLDPATAIGYARDLDILPNTLPPERHLGYAVQWFAMAAAVLVIALLLTFRTRKRAAMRLPA